jgi:hypothetical protein
MYFSILAEALDVVLLVFIFCKRVRRCTLEPYLDRYYLSLVQKLTSAAKHMSIAS